LVVAALVLAGSIAVSAITEDDLVRAVISCIQPSVITVEPV
jgi:hypothetical protein